MWEKDTNLAYTRVTIIYGDPLCALEEVGHNQPPPEVQAIHFLPRVTSQEELNNSHSEGKSWG